MSKISFLIVILVFVFHESVCTGEQPSRPFHEMTNLEIDPVIRTVAGEPLTVTEKINVFSGYFLGMPYNLTCVGDGPYALLEAWPLVNFSETNCMAYCEHVLALAISDDWDHFFNNLQQIRYQDGIIGMKTRNHYTMADWLPENGWLLEDAAGKVAGDRVETVTRVISHNTFFTGKGMTDMAYVKPDRELTVHYVPLEILQEVEAETCTGDILALIFRDKEDIFSAHMLMIAEKDGQKMIRESSNSKMTTFDTPYQEWVAAVQQNRSKRYLGLAFMRVREELNTPGRIILPWEIAGLKRR